MQGLSRDALSQTGYGQNKPIDPKSSSPGLYNAWGCSGLRQVLSLGLGALPGFSFQVFRLRGLGFVGPMFIETCPPPVHGLGMYLQHTRLNLDTLVFLSDTP